MSANTANRSATRIALADLLSTALVGVGKPCQEVIAYKSADFYEKSPVVLVLSGGTPQRKRFGMGTVKYQSLFRIDILAFVADVSAAESWTRQNVEDTLDQIEKIVADVVADNRNTATWSDMKIMDGGSTIVPARPETTGGKPFMLETISVIAEVIDA